MFRLLFIFFIIVPVIEIAVIMQVGTALGTWPTVAIIIFTAWFGAKKVGEQGGATLTSVQAKIAQGEIPSDEIIEGLMLLIAGILLLTPGFVTDTLGLALLFEPIRKSLVKILKKHFIVAQVQSSAFTQKYQHDCIHEQCDVSSSTSKNTIEGDFERKD